MIYFHAVDFSERRSEEVISFFWRPVYSLWFTLFYLPEYIFRTHSWLAVMTLFVSGNFMKCVSPEFKDVMT